ncbi:hypothetical protein MXB_3276 [Myxobolus squamalis]|nr:hypothetical protein MXB_3276 [Myxobolus squamalis]
MLGKQESLIIFDVDQPCQENKPVYPSISHSISDPFISDSHSISDSKRFGQPVVSLKKGVDQTVLSPKKGADQTVLSPKKDVDQIVSNFLGTSGANLVDMSDFESKSRALGLHSSSRHLNPFNEPRNISAAVTNTVPKGFQSDSNVFSSSSVHQLKKSPEMSLRSQIGTLAPNNPFFKNQPAVSSRDQKFDDLFGELQSTQFSFDNNPAQPEKDLFSDF